MPLTKHLKSSKVLYIVVGVTVYIFELIIIYIAHKIQDNDLVSVGLSFWLGLLLSFSLQKMITFKDKRLEKHILIPQIVAVCALVLFNFGFTLWITQLLSKSFSPFLTRTFALGITTIWNFYLYKTRIFKDNRSIPID